MNRVLAATLALVSLLTACKGDGPAATAANAPGTAGLTKVRMATAGAASDAGLYIAMDKGYFKDQGLEIEIATFNSGADILASLNSGQLDVGGGGAALGLYELVGRGGKLRIVADKGQTPNPQWDYIALMVRKDLIDAGRVKDYGDFKGLTIAASGKGNPQELSLFTGLARGGVAEKDVTYINLGYADMPAAFGNYSLDAAMVAEPFLTRIESAKSPPAVRFEGMSQVLGRNQHGAVILFSDAFAARTDDARRWMIAYVRGLRDYNDALTLAGRPGWEDVVKSLIAHTPVKDRQLYEQMKMAYLDPDGKLELDYFRFELDYWVRSGQLKSNVDLSKLIDTSFQEYSVQQLGPYQR